MTTNPSYPDSEKYVFPQRYKDIQPLAEGGMGSVFKANDPVLYKTVALKFLNYDAWDDEQFVRFQKEARALARLKHPGIGAILDFGINERGQPYMVLDLIEGIDLAHIRDDQTISLTDVVSIMIQVCDALSHAHEKGIVHRDIKPSNIIVSRDEKGWLRATLIDFGVAKLVDSSEQATTVTRSGSIVGSPLYMSPEQIQSASIAPESDIYSLGCVLYFLLTGSPPFQADTAIATASMHLNNSPPPINNDTSELAAKLGEIVTRCLQKNPSKRFHSTKELREVLNSVNLHTVSSESPDTVSVDRTSHGKRPRGVSLVIVLGLLSLALIGGVITVILKDSLENQQLDQIRSGMGMYEVDKSHFPPEAPESLMKTSFEIAPHNMYTWNKSASRLTIFGRDNSKAKADLQMMELILKNNEVNSVVIAYKHLPLLPRAFMVLMQKQPKLYDFELVEVEDADLNSLLPIPSVIVFRITSHRFNGTTLKTLERFKSIRKVCLNGCRRIKAEYLQDLAAIKDLNAIEMVSIRSVQKEDLAELARLPIQELVLTKSQFEASNITQLLKTQTIKDLSMKQTSVTDVDVKMLQRISSLRYMDLSECISVTKATVEQIPKRIKVEYAPD
ncbi:MAG: serine/threonine protein kinase [Candidatus Obscuribacterales bacterium]|nr:serine/threonine protein kinase [Candidatus Obscuribacterales bacterium]